MALARFPNQIISVHRAYHAAPPALIVETPFGSFYELGSHIVGRFFFSRFWLSVAGPQRGSSRDGRIPT